MRITNRIGTHTDILNYANGSKESARPIFADGLFDDFFGGGVGTTPSFSGLTPRARATFFFCLRRN